MTAKWEKQEGNEGILTFEVDVETFEHALDIAFKKVVKTVQIPGFRKGRIPRKIFENRFGVESLYQDAIDIVLPDAYKKAMDETDIFPIVQPEVDIETVERGKDLVFSAKVTVKPEVDLGEYKGLEVEEQDTDVTDDDVEEELERLREQHAELIVKEEGEVEEGDTVVMDFEGFLDGEAFDGGKGENQSLEIGSGQFIPGFEEELTGKKAGEETEINVTFPEDYHADNLAGKEAVFKVKIHEIKVKELQELDDEFAKDVDEEVETLAELREKQKEQLASRKKQDAENKKRETLIEKATNNAEVDIPDVMVKSELDRMINELEQQLQMQGMTMEMYYKFSNQDEAAIRDQMKEDAAKRIKTNLTLNAIFDKEELEVTEEEVNEQLENMAKMYNMDIDNIKSMLGANTESIKEELKFKKTVDFLEDNSKTA